MENVSRFQPDSKVRLALTLNDEPRDVVVESYKTLLEVVREDLGLTGTKHGCELGECGACAVILDGELVLSCLVAAVECQGRSAITVEGLRQGPELHPLQAAFADHGAAQCGYLSLIHISEPTRLLSISYAVFCLK